MKEDKIASLLATIVCIIVGLVCCIPMLLLTFLSAPKTEFLLVGVISIIISMFMLWLGIKIGEGQ